MDQGARGWAKMVRPAAAGIVSHRQTSTQTNGPVDAEPARRSFTVEVDFGLDQVIKRSPSTGARGHGTLPSSGRGEQRATQQRLPVQ